MSINPGKFHVGLALGTRVVSASHSTTLTATCTLNHKEAVKEWVKYNVIKALLYGNIIEKVQQNKDHHIAKAS